MGALQNLLAGLDPRPDATNPTAGQRLAAAGPLLTTLATVAIALGCAFGLVPGGDLQTALGILGGGAIVHYVHSQS